MIRRLCLLLPILISAIAATAGPRPVPLQGPWDLQDGDRIVFLGDAYLEREGNYGYLETLLTTAYPQKNLTFRNLAWSGDTPKCESRSYFGPPEEGFSRLKGHLELVKPSLVFAGYGAASAMDGEKGLGPFIENYKRLLDMISQTTSATVVLLSPVPGEEKGELKAQMAGRNQQIARYSEAIRRLAAERQLRFVDLVPAIQGVYAKSPAPLTLHGVHLSEKGCRAVAPAVVQSLGLGKSATGISEKLRAAIQAKNLLFFNRWRPQNETYLFGFRKHEQGNNAVEIPQFDPLIEAKEKEIAAMRTEQPIP